MDRLISTIETLYGLGWLMALPPVAGHLVVAAHIVTLMAFASFAYARAGLSPLWVLALLVPGLNVATLWLLAYTRWPKVDGPPRIEPRG